MKAIATAVLCVVSVCILVSACGNNDQDILPTSLIGATLVFPAKEVSTTSSLSLPIESSDFIPLDPVAGLGNVLEGLVGETIFQLEVARTPEDRASGLMGRSNLPEDAAMLFVYGSDNYLTFWMKNTLIPLDVLFLNERGFVVDIQTMHTQTGTPDRVLKLYRSALPARFALEINAGLADTLGIATGTQFFFR